MTLENLVSKVLAAGLAAGVFLLWWPAHLPSAGAQWLVLRGLAWTLAFEVLVLAFAPLEQMVTRALVRRRAAAQAQRVRVALATAPATARKGGAVLLAFTGLLVPAFLLAHTSRPQRKPVARPTTVVRKVVVRREVVRREKVVVRVPVASAPTPQPPATTKPAQTTQPNVADEPKTEHAIDAAPKQTTPKTATTAVPEDPTTVPPPADAATAPVQDAAADPAGG
jgi:hypothetical protein